MSEQKSATRGPHQSDSYFPAGDWIAGPKLRESARIETWRINSQNMSKMFASIYGSEYLPDTLQVVEAVGLLHIREPNKYNPPFVRGAWETLNHRLIQGLQDSTKVLRLRAKVERPTYGQLKAIGLTIDHITGRNAFQLPTAFNLNDPGGYLQLEIIRK